MSMAHYAYDNISKVTLLTAKMVLRTFSTIADTFVFLYMGLAVFAFEFSFKVWFIAVAVVAVLLGRTHVFIITKIFNWIHKVTSKTDQNRIPTNHAVMVYYCGLRGAVAFALGVLILNDKAVVHREDIFATSTMIVVLSVLLFGGFTPLALKKLNLDESGLADARRKFEESMGVRRGSQESSRESVDTIDEYLVDKQDRQQILEEANEFMEAMNSGLFSKFYEIDKRYIRPFFAATKKAPKSFIPVKRGEIDPHGISSEHYQNLIMAQNNNSEKLLKNDVSDSMDNMSIAQAAEMIGIGSAIAIQETSGALYPEKFLRRNESFNSLQRSSNSGIELLDMRKVHGISSSNRIRTPQGETMTSSQKSIFKSSSTLERKPVLDTTPTTLVIPLPQTEKKISDLSNSIPITSFSEFIGTATPSTIPGTPTSGRRDEKKVIEEGDMVNIDINTQ
jgi:hypothetical protein